MEQRTFSVIEAIKYGFTAFYNHIALLAGIVLTNAGIIYGLPKLALYLSPTFMADLTTLQEKLIQETPLILEELKTFFSDHGLFMILFTLSFLTLLIINAGIIQVSFDIVDTNSSSFNRLFSWVSRAPRIIGFLLTAIFLGFLFIIGSFGLFLVSGFIASKVIPEQHLQLFMVLLIGIMVISFFYLFMRFFLSWYSFIGQKNGIFHSLKHSWNISRGNVLRIFALLLILMPLLIPFSLLSLLFGVDSIMFLVGYTIGLITILSITYAYRKLSPANS